MPPTGKRPLHNAKSIARNARKNAGIDIPRNEKNDSPRSSNEFCLTATMIPIGIASAHEAGDGSGSTNCTSDDVQHQSNKGHQLVGGNLAAQDAETNVLGAQATRPAGICPSVANNNHL